MSGASSGDDQALSPLERVAKESGPDPTSGAQAVTIPTWLREKELPPQVQLDQAGPNSEVGPGVVNVPAADGYHFADDHKWGAKQQSALVTSLAELENSLQ